MAYKSVNILGIRGLPAAHGGFETFAGKLAPYLQERGWSVNVYCQLTANELGVTPANYEDNWRGINRINIGTKSSSPASTMLFDWRCTLDVLHRPGVDLVLGYNTAIFSVVPVLFRRSVIMNMDGIEWKRDKWSKLVKIWFYINEFIGANTATLAIADHPEIANHLRRHGLRKSVMIPYGADRITAASPQTISKFDIEPNNYIVSIARIEPENSILEIVREFSRQPRGLKLVILGRLDNNNNYHQSVQQAASDEVLFCGAIYDPEIVSALRFHARAYVHGHQVGGTNPSLVEALGAGNAVIAHDNRFNRWVAGPEQAYFKSERDLALIFNEKVHDSTWLTNAKSSSVARFEESFTWDIVLAAYEKVLASNLR